MDRANAADRRWRERGVKVSSASLTLRVGAHVKNTVGRIGGLVESTRLGAASTE